MTRTERRIRRHIENLGSSDDNVAIKAEQYLITYYGARALEPLIRACAHENPKVRFRAVWALAWTKDTAAFDTIAKLIIDPDEHVRYDSRIALGIHGDSRALPVLKEACQTPDDMGVAFMGLAKMGLQSLPIYEELLQSESPHLRYCALNCIGSLSEETGDSRCFAHLHHHIHDSDEYVRSDAKFWLDGGFTNRSTDKRTASP
jgi:HEAT repeat protein